MKAGEDPFERAFQDYLAGRINGKVTVYCDKSEPDEIYVKYFFRTYDEMPDLEKKALDLCFGSVLDVGAGSGCHSLILMEKGFDVTALDIRHGFVDVMKKRGINKTVCKDVFDYSDETFDTLILLMNGIGFGGTLKGLERFLNHAKRLLNSGGQILLDSSDLLYLSEEEDGSYRINMASEYYGEVIFQIEYKGEKGQPFPWLFVDFGTLQQKAEDAGFATDLILEGDHFDYLAKLYIP
jgi:SAM-dependent methyltransferase